MRKQFAGEVIHSKCKTLQALLAVTCLRSNSPVQKHNYEISSNQNFKPHSDTAGFSLDSLQMLYCWCTASWDWDYSQSTFNAVPQISIEITYRIRDMRPSWICGKNGSLTFVHCLEKGLSLHGTRFSRFAFKSEVSKAVVLITRTPQQRRWQIPCHKGWILAFSNGLTTDGSRTTRRTATSYQAMQSLASLRTLARWGHFVNARKEFIEPNDLVSGRIIYSGLTDVAASQIWLHQCQNTFSVRVMLFQSASIILAQMLKAANNDSFVVQSCYAHPYLRRALCFSRHNASRWMTDLLNTYRATDIKTIAHHQHEIQHYRTTKANPQI